MHFNLLSQNPRPPTPSLSAPLFYLSHPGHILTPSLCNAFALSYCCLASSSKRKSLCLCDKLLPAPRSFCDAAFTAFRRAETPSSHCRSGCHGSRQRAQKIWLHRVLGHCASTAFLPFGACFSLSVSSCPSSLPVTPSPAAAAVALPSPCFLPSRGSTATVIYKRALFSWRRIDIRQLFENTSTYRLASRAVRHITHRIEALLQDQLLVPFEGVLSGANFGHGLDLNHAHSLCSGFHLRLLPLPPVFLLLSFIHSLGGLFPCVSLNIAAALISAPRNRLQATSHDMREPRISTLGVRANKTFDHAPSSEVHLHLG